MRPLHLFCRKSFLQKSFVEELAEKLLFCTKSAYNHLTATYGLSVTLGPTSMWWVRRVYPKIATFGPESAAWGGEWMA